MGLRTTNSAGKAVGLQYPGQLPTLGLNKYKNNEIQNDPTNPYRVQRQTEKLLVVREREREMRDFNKLEKDNLKVFEKNIATR